MNAIYETIEHYRVLLSSYPFVIQVALVMIFINFVVTLFFFAFTYFIRKKRKKEDSIIEDLYPKTTRFIEAIFKADQTYSEAEIYNIFVEKFGKLKEKSYIALVPTLEDLIQKNSDYLESKNYLNVIKGLKIDTHLEQKLSFSSTRSRLRAFQSLSRLNLIISDSKILPYTYSKNKSLRKESRASYIGVSNNDPFKFFDRENPELNHWDQINLIKQLEMHHKDNLPNFSKWIKYTKDKSQNIFLIRAVAYFKQLNSVSALEELLESEDHDIRKEAILALSEMRITSVEEKLKKIYYNQPSECQKAIIEAVALMQTGKSLNFLKDAFFEATNADIKKLIAEGIYLYGEEGKKYFDHLCKIEDGFDLLILQHVKNPMIPSKLKEKLLKDQKKKTPELAFT
ncbi:MAG: HEAT repeat domain-containing protein [Flavobacteriaceae bacterium]